MTVQDLSTIRWPKLWQKSHLARCLFKFTLVGVLLLIVLVGCHGNALVSGSVLLISILIQNIIDLKVLLRETNDLYVLVVMLILRRVLLFPRNSISVEYDQLPLVL